MKKVISLVFALLLTLFLLAACGSPAEVKEAYVDTNGNIVVLYEDGTMKVLGKADLPTEVTAQSAAVDAEGNIVVTFSDGSTAILGKAENPVVKSVRKITVNEEMHAIVEYEDGTTQDLGYVDVEVETPLFTVTFVDINGNTLKTETVFRGKDATAPTAPKIENKVFEKWDEDFSNVQSNLTVKAIYRDKVFYTLTFLDTSGNVIATKTVAEGMSTTAPTPPTVDGKIFVKWDKDFSKVQSDLTLKPIYKDKPTYTVTFVDINGKTIKTETVIEGKSATAPTPPAVDGRAFDHWDKDFTNVRTNLKVNAVYREIYYGHWDYTKPEIYITLFSDGWEFWNCNRAEVVAGIEAGAPVTSDAADEENKKYYYNRLCVEWSRSECDAIAGIGTEDYAFGFNLYVKDADDEDAQYEKSIGIIETCYIWDTSSWDSPPVYHLQTLRGGWNTYNVGTTYEIVIEITKNGEPIAWGTVYVELTQSAADSIYYYREFGKILDADDGRQKYYEGAELDKIEITNYTPSKDWAK